MSDANSILMGAKVASATFKAPGDMVAGRIVAISEPYQERDYDKQNPGQGTPRTFPSGDPIMTFHFDVQTDLRDRTIEDDDGIRRVYADGQRIKKALRAAILAAGAKGLAIGSTITIIYTSQDPSTAIPAKNWEVTYVPDQAANGVLMGQQPPAAPAPQYAQQAPAPQQQYAQPQAPQQAPAQQYVAQPASAPAAPAAPDPVQLSAVIAAGADPRAVFAAQFPAWAASYQPQG